MEKYNSKYLLNFLNEENVTKLYSEKKLEINNYLCYNNLQIFTTTDGLKIVDKNSNDRIPFFHKNFESVDCDTDSLKIYENGDEIFLYNMREGSTSLELNVFKIERLRYSLDYEFNSTNFTSKKKFRNVQYMCDFIETVKINTEQTVIKNHIINNKIKFCWSDDYLTVYLTDKINVYDLKTLDLKESFNFDYGSVQKCTKIENNKFLCLKRIIQQKNELASNDRYLSGFNSFIDNFSIIWQVFEIEIGISKTINSTNCKLIYSSAPLTRRTCDEKFYFDSFFSDQNRGFCFYVNGTNKIYVNGVLVPIGSNDFFGEIENFLNMQIYNLNNKLFLFITLEDKIISLNCQTGLYNEKKRIFDYKVDELHMFDNENYFIDYKIDKILIDSNRNINYLVKITDYYQYKDYECFTNVFDYKILTNSYKTLSTNFEDNGSDDFLIDKNFKYMEVLLFDEIIEIRDLKHTFKSSYNFKKVLDVISSYLNKYRAIKSAEFQELFDEEILLKEEKKLFDNCRLELISSFTSKLSGNSFYNKNMSTYVTPYLHSDGWCYNEEDFDKLKVEDGSVENDKEVDTKLIKAMNILQLNKMHEDLNEGESKLTYVAKIGYVKRCGKEYDCKSLISGDENDNRISQLSFISTSSNDNDICGN